MKLNIDKLPPQYKKYAIVMSDGARFIVASHIYNRYKTSESQLVELPDGTTINKSFVMRVEFDREETRREFMDRARLLPAAVKRQMLDLYYEQEAPLKIIPERSQIGGDWT